MAKNKILTLKMEGNGFNALANLASDFGADMQKESRIAVNRTTKFHKGQIAKSVSAEVAIKQKDVKKQLNVTQAKRGRKPSASLLVDKTSRLPLKYFGARQTKAGVSYKIDKKGGRKKIKSAFISNRLGGHAFIRKDGKKRLRIRKIFGASVAGVYAKNKLIETSKEQLAERLNYEMTRRVRAVNVRLIRRKGRKQGLSTEQINRQLEAL